MFISLYLKMWSHFQEGIFLTNKTTFKTTIGKLFKTHSKFLIEIFMEITVDSHAVLRNNSERSHIYPVSLNSNILKNIAQRWLGGSVG